MPTFTAIALDRLIEPGAVKSMSTLRDSPSSRLERSISTPNSREESGLDSSSAELGRRVGVPPNRKSERGVSVPPIVKQEKPISIPSNVKHDRRNGASTTTVSVVDKKYHWTQISPALYATPESTPLPDSPSSFPPSPYIINHKRRGPRLIKSFSEDYVVTHTQVTDEIKVDENGNAAENDVASTPNDDASVPREVLDSNMNDDIKPSDARDANGKHLNGVCNDGHGSRNVERGPVGQINVAKSVAFNLQQDGDVDDFVEPHDSMSAKSIGENEGNVAVERSWNSTTPMTEFYDAWEELSSESGPQHLMPDIETELREIRLSLLMEIEKRKQAEETLTNMRSQWQRIREQLSLVGLTLPVDPTTLSEGEQPADPAAEICQQVHLVRFVSFSIGRGAAKAEVETETEAQVKLKNSEIARLWDRLHYYEAVNQEMSQRNQEIVETARRLRQRRKRRQKWVWGSIAAAVTLGSAVLAYSYFHSGKGSSSQSTSDAPRVDRKPN
ncbi:hypothetical protein Sango_1902000 [Sesamum angolense]|uniref:Uncharacterized protein n=1 Tax=Sesamum angolense TaxID=2727404 RepID=A0AAE1WJ34_9LAMI|nr:hypothetical protein Sango_1902000 [Sesamum angolense]